MNARERLLATLAFEPVDRLPFMEMMWYWPETLDRWIEEGFPKDISPLTYFGYDRLDIAPVNFNFISPFERIVLEEDEHMRIVRDETGVTKKEFKYGSAMPHYIDFPIKTHKDFLELKERLDGRAADRYPPNWDELAANWKTRDYPLWAVCRGFLAFERDFMKFEDMSMAFLMEPDWIHEMMAFHAQFMIDMWTHMVQTVEIDFIVLGEDMAFKNGPMISPAFVKEFMLPNYKKIIGFLKDNGIKNVIVDSDGDITSLIPIYIEAGFTGILPIERNAMPSPTELRKRYPKLQMIGGLNKQTIALGGDALKNEIDQVVRPLAKTGGYIPSFDHSVHPATSLSVYKQYLDQLRDAIADV